MKKLKISINGIHCASCGTNLQKSIGKVKGVRSVTVNVITKKAFVDADDSADEEEIKKSISRVGNYKVLNIEKN